MLVAAVPLRAARAQGADTGAGTGVRAAAAAPVDPDAPTIAARADKTEAHVGDRIRVSVVAVAKSAIPVNLPGSLDLGAFSVLSREEGPVQNLGDGRVRREFTLTVAAYEPGDVELPAIEVTYLGARGDVKTVRTEPLAIKIASVIANEPEPTLKEGTTTVSVLEENRLPLYVGGGVLAAALGALISFFIVRKLRMRPGERLGPPPRPAHEIALERLDRLGAYGFIENADNRPFYFAVSEIIRDYLGGAVRVRLAGDDDRRAGRRAAAPRWPRAPAERGQGLAVGVRPGQVRQGVAERRRGARHAGGRDPDRDHQPSGARAAGAAPGRTCRGGTACVGSLGC